MRKSVCITNVDQDPLWNAKIEEIQNVSWAFDPAADSRAYRSTQPRSRSRSRLRSTARTRMESNYNRHQSNRSSSEQHPCHHHKLSAVNTEWPKPVEQAYLPQLMNVRPTHVRSRAFAESKCFAKESGYCPKLKIKYENNTWVLDSDLKEPFNNAHSEENVQKFHPILKRKKRKKSSMRFAVQKKLKIEIQEACHHVQTSAQQFTFQQNFKSEESILNGHRAEEQKKSVDIFVLDPNPSFDILISKLEWFDAVAEKIRHASQGLNDNNLEFLQEHYVHSEHNSKSKENCDDNHPRTNCEYSDHNSKQNCALNDYNSNHKKCVIKNRRVPCQENCPLIDSNSSSPANEAAKALLTLSRAGSHCETGGEEKGKTAVEKRSEVGDSISGKSKKFEKCHENESENSNCLNREDFCVDQSHSKSEGSQGFVEESDCDEDATFKDLRTALSVTEKSKSVHKIGSEGHAISNVKHKNSTFENSANFHWRTNKSNALCKESKTGGKGTCLRNIDLQQASSKNTNSETLTETESLNIDKIMKEAIAEPESNLGCISQHSSLIGDGVEDATGIDVENVFGTNASLRFPTPKDRYCSTKFKVSEHNQNLKEGHYSSNKFKTPECSGSLDTAETTVHSNSENFMNGEDLNNGKHNSFSVSRFSMKSGSVNNDETNRPNPENLRNTEHHSSSKSKISEISESFGIVETKSHSVSSKNIMDCQNLNNAENLSATESEFPMDNCNTNTVGTPSFCSYVNSNNSDKIKSANIFDIHSCQNSGTSLNRRNFRVSCTHRSKANSILSSKGEGRGLNTSPVTVPSIQNLPCDINDIKAFAQRLPSSESFSETDIHMNNAPMHESSTQSPLNLNRPCKANPQTLPLPPFESLTSEKSVLESSSRFPSFDSIMHSSLKSVPANRLSAFNSSSHGKSVFSSKKVCDTVSCQSFSKYSKTGECFPSKCISFQSQLRRLSRTIPETLSVSTAVQSRSQPNSPGEASPQSSGKLSGFQTVVTSSFKATSEMELPGILSPTQSDRAGDVPSQKQTSSKGLVMRSSTASAESVQQASQSPSELDSAGGNFFHSNPRLLHFQTNVDSCSKVLETELPAILSVSQSDNADGGSPQSSQTLPSFQTLVRSSSPSRKSLSHSHDQNASEENLRLLAIYSVLSKSSTSKTIVEPSCSQNTTLATSHPKDVQNSQQENNASKPVNASSSLCHQNVTLTSASTDSKGVQNFCQDDSMKQSTEAVRGVENVSINIFPCRKVNEQAKLGDCVSSIHQPRLSVAQEEEIRSAVASICNLLGEDKKQALEEEIYECSERDEDFWMNDDKEKRVNGVKEVERQEDKNTFVQEGEMKEKVGEERWIKKVWEDQEEENGRHQKEAERQEMQKNHIQLGEKDVNFWLFEKDNVEDLEEKDLEKQLVMENQNGMIVEVEKCSVLKNKEKLTENVDFWLIEEEVMEAKLKEKGFDKEASKEDEGSKEGEESTLGKNEKNIDNWLNEKDNDKEKLKEKDLGKEAVKGNKEKEEGEEALKKNGENVFEDVDFWLLEEELNQGNLKEKDLEVEKEMEKKSEKIEEAQKGNLLKDKENLSENVDFWLIEEEEDDKVEKLKEKCLENERNENGEKVTIQNTEGEKFINVDFWLRSNKAHNVQEFKEKDLVEYGGKEKGENEEEEGGTVKRGKEERFGEVDHRCIRVDGKKEAVKDVQDSGSKKKEDGGNYMGSKKRHDSCDGEEENVDEVGEKEDAERGKNKVDEESVEKEGNTKEKNLNENVIEKEEQKGKGKEKEGAKEKGKKQEEIEIDLDMLWEDEETEDSYCEAENEEDEAEEVQDDKEEKNKEECKMGSQIEEEEKWKELGNRQTVKIELVGKEVGKTAEGKEEQGQELVEKERKEEEEKRQKGDAMEERVKEWTEFSDQNNRMDKIEKDGQWSRKSMEEKTNQGNDGSEEKELRQEDTDDEEEEELPPLTFDSPIQTRRCLKSFTVRSSRGSEEKELRQEDTDDEEEEELPPLTFDSPIQTRRCLKSFTVLSSRGSEEKELRQEDTDDEEEEELPPLTFDSPIQTRRCLKSFTVLSSQPVPFNKSAWSTLTKDCGDASKNDACKNSHFLSDSHITAPNQTLMDQAVWKSYSTESFVEDNSDLKSGLNTDKTIDCGNVVSPNSTLNTVILTNSRSEEFTALDSSLSNKPQHEVTDERSEVNVGEDDGQKSGKKANHYVESESRLFETSSASNEALFLGETASSSLTYSNNRTIHVPSPFKNLPHRDEKESTSLVSQTENGNSSVFRVKYDENSFSASTASNLDNTKKFTVHCSSPQKKSKCSFDTRNETPVAVLSLEDDSLIMIKDETVSDFDNHSLHDLTPNLDVMEKFSVHISSPLTKSQSSKANESVTEVFKQEEGNLPTVEEEEPEFDINNLCTSTPIQGVLKKSMVHVSSPVSNFELSDTRSSPAKKEEENLESDSNNVCSSVPKSGVSEQFTAHETTSGTDLQVSACLSDESTALVASPTTPLRQVSDANLLTDKSNTHLTNPLTAHQQVESTNVLTGKSSAHIANLSTNLQLEVTDATTGAPLTVENFSIIKKEIDLAAGFISLTASFETEASQELEKNRILPPQSLMSDLNDTETSQELKKNISSPQSLMSDSDDTICLEDETFEAESLENLNFNANLKKTQSAYCCPKTFGFGEPEDVNKCIYAEPLFEVRDANLDAIDVGRTEAKNSTNAPIPVALWINTSTHLTSQLERQTTDFGEITKPCKPCNQTEQQSALSKSESRTSSSFTNEMEDSQLSPQTQEPNPDDIFNSLLDSGPSYLEKCPSRKDNSRLSYLEQRPNPKDDLRLSHLEKHSNQKESHINFSKEIISHSKETLLKVRELTEESVPCSNITECRSRKRRRRLKSFGDQTNTISALPHTFLSKIKNSAFTKSDSYDKNEDVLNVKREMFKRKRRHSSNTITNCSEKRPSYVSQEVIRANQTAISVNDQSKQENLSIVQKASPSSKASTNEKTATCLLNPAESAISDTVGGLSNKVKSANNGKPSCDGKKEINSPSASTKTENGLSSKANSLTSKTVENVLTNLADTDSENNETVACSFKETKSTTAASKKRDLFSNATNCVTFDTVKNVLLDSTDSFNKETVSCSSNSVETNFTDSGIQIESVTMELENLIDDTSDLETESLQEEGEEDEDTMDSDTVLQFCKFRYLSPSTKSLNVHALSSFANSAEGLGEKNVSKKNESVCSASSLAEAICQGNVSKVNASSSISNSDQVVCKKNVLEDEVDSMCQNTVSKDRVDALCQNTLSENTVDEVCQSTVSRATGGDEFQPMSTSENEAFCKGGGTALSASPPGPEHKKASEDGDSVNGAILHLSCQELCDWSRGDVAHWLNSIGLDDLAMSCDNLDGPTLLNLKQLQTNTPAQFFRQVATLNIPFLRIMLFSCFLRQLTLDE